MDRLAAEGALFVNSFHAVPLCSPNRATLLTGQFPSRHGIIDNIARNLASHHLETFNLPMKTAGYRTAFLGKWHMGNDPTPRPGWDYWVAMPDRLQLPKAPVVSSTWTTTAVVVPPGAS